ncbi:MAG: hypothetical protein ACP5PW_02040 [Candidatus Dormibacteria bacterium]
MTATLLVALAVFGACAVEMVEALTIVLAAGLTRGWRSALEGSAVAVVVLAAVVAALGPALIHLVPISVLRVVVGSLLLVLGLQWLRKAILRASGHKPKHDEDAIYRREVARLSGLPRPAAGRDATGFVIAFKGVLLEGTEVVMIVLTLGLSSGRLEVAALGAGAAILVVGVVGALVARQLSEVPENALKLGVGLMLVTFGTFWAGEGVGVSWPGTDLFLLGLLALYAVATWVLVMYLGRQTFRPEVLA